MYYNRTISKEFEELLKVNGKLRWLFDFVKNHNELDFLIGRNNSSEWVSVYRGLSRIISLSFVSGTTIRIDAAERYKSIIPDLYGVKKTGENFSKEIEYLITQIRKDGVFDRYYENRKEGYFQNELSKIFGICGSDDTEFVIVDKEAVVGYDNQAAKDELFGNIQSKYKSLQKEISTFDAKSFGQNLEQKAIGNELDFLALDKEGNILLIEYKHGTNTSGIYLSPLQIGLYYEIFTSLPKKELDEAVIEMLEQKKRIGLINPKWKTPEKINGIIPVLIISEYNNRSSAKDKFQEILNFSRSQLGDNFLDNLKTYNYTSSKGLTSW